MGESRVVAPHVKKQFPKPVSVLFASCSKNRFKIGETIRASAVNTWPGTELPHTVTNMTHKVAAADLETPTANR